MVPPHGHKKLGGDNPSQTHPVAKRRPESSYPSQIRNGKFCAALPLRLHAQYLRYRWHLYFIDRISEMYYIIKEICWETMGIWKMRMDISEADVPGLARRNEEKQHEEFHDCSCGYRRCWIVLCGVASTA